ncbi:hypothetical protein NP233_g10137 [Leucocoprinus birnbaumii]|uniref:Uncharacterized protein n=1 Tax=Leucocoprinus birnbaumii TaxID=56174 RepID=A0AAD5YS72_9AGAR|nr:hypothetical protein NP233_g10137 [Leucocoprinus birnbaumii]
MRFFNCIILAATFCGTLTSAIPVEADAGKFSMVLLRITDKLINQLRPAARPVPSATTTSLPGDGIFIKNVFYDSDA